MDSVRIDKWLWAMRFFKTRTIAAQACDLKRVSVAGQTVKPSKHIKAGDRIEVKWSGGLKRTIEVIQVTEKRLGAKLVVDFYKDHTPQKEIDDYKARVARAAEYRTPGVGRPTKKDRRVMDDFLESFDGHF